MDPDEQQAGVNRENETEAQRDERIIRLRHVVQPIFNHVKDAGEEKQADEPANIPFSIHTMQSTILPADIFIILYT